ncbi:menaquinone-specific isochorismate synthase [Vibrio sp. MACH09]|nr:menaquinone-specific isochorismate synthase [Vibrio sp. MACH09]
MNFSIDILEVDLSQFSQAIAELIQQIKDANEHDSKLTQAIDTLAGFSCVDWLEAQPHFPKFYWQSRDTREEVVALGKVHAFSDPAPAYTILADGQRVWGGRAFQSSEDDGLPSSLFFLPQIELVRFDDQWSISVNLDNNKSTIISALKQLCCDYLELPSISTNIQSISHIPEQSDWNDQIEDVLDKIKQDQFKKVVLARKSIVQLDGQLSPAQLLKASVAHNHHSFHFLFALDASQSFVGSTPERLYSRNGQELETEALAGTIGRGKTARKDLDLANWLAQDKKNLCENQYVVDDIVARLEPHSTAIEAQNEARLIRLRKVQHLKREIRASLKSGVNGVQLLSALQPTAAVAGLPREEAMKYILQHQPFSRGWYSGSIGYISHHKAEFCVAIRSALVNGDQVNLYAGAGIVEGSQAEYEWQELDKKMSTLLCLLKDRQPQDDSMQDEAMSASSNQNSASFGVAS